MMTSFLKSYSLSKLFDSSSIANLELRYIYCTYIHLHAFYNIFL